VKRLADSYEEVRNWVTERSYKIGLLMPYIEDDIFYYEFFGEIKPKLSLSRGEAVIVLQDIIRGCEVAERSLEALLRLHVEPGVLDELNSLRRELEELESRGLDPNIVKNLREAITEAEQGHYLASAMIASRVICYVISKIPGERDEDKAEHLVKRGAVPKDRKDIQKQLVTAMRLSRNFLSHRVDLFPSPEEVLMLLGGAFVLARLTILITR